MDSRQFDFHIINQIQQLVNRYERHFPIGIIANIRYPWQIAPSLVLITASTFLPGRKTIQMPILMDKNRCCQHRCPIDSCISRQLQGQKATHRLAYQGYFVTTACQQGIAITDRIIPFLPACSCQSLRCRTMSSQAYSQHCIALSMEIPSQQQHLCRSTCEAMCQNYTMLASLKKERLPSL